MPLKSRWAVDVPRCSLQQWIFDSPCGPLPDRRAYIDPEQPDTNYLDLSSYRLLAKRVALGLQQAGLKEGDRVLLFSGNNIFFPSIFLGILMAGGIFTGANPSFVARELAYQLRDSEASFLVTAQGSLETAFQAAKEAGLPRDRIFVLGGDTPAAQEVVLSSNPGPGLKGRVAGARHWTELLQGNAKEAESWSWKEPKDPQTTTCCLNYSSGTTGVPKGVEISHYCYVANGVQVIHLNNLNPDWEERQKRARALCFLPLYHAYGQTYFVANMPRAGIPIYIMPSFDFVKMLEYVQRYRITSLTCVPPIVVALAKSPLTKKYDLSSVEGLGSGAAPLAKEVSDEAEKLFNGKFRLRQGWGMTETTCTCMSWDPLNKEPSSGVGEMMPNCSGKLMSLDGKVEITKAGERGEFWVTGPNLMRGYWRKPEATAETVVVDADGTRWLKTGDIAYFDAYKPGGIVHIVDRLKELIKVKGNQVAPAELEGLLLEHPEVADAAVIGVTINGEEVPRAYIVRQNPKSKITGQEIAGWMAGKVTRYKQLKGGVVFTDNIPKNPSGKILRRQLRDRADKEVGEFKSKL
ncbi:acetyl-CoA synthetase-like protein [Neurospora crassa]|uniref:4-coumarate-CoA ligase n=1 Tax=Neurospora crassa (strain ATCC 24698 / 74-OR23-1A / CBS 708.71 / DSM 1257 / FGSC 987) TaxID=367110 RepID=Q7S7K3_NEUCR|nr:4-coumarate-CoA ligase [Neurospora crassa OR74A]EAA31676.3 4-coumarate-CoA ligase [Neurospora crassa OR74A]KHE86938.1 acetyl-CoA synthetase-like protein [Neurospora crassa]|eukprot:XP_960912.3 4-coumarate-CoA ligase [Neurospora crassa OR74A]